MEGLLSEDGPPDDDPSRRGSLLFPSNACTSKAYVREVQCGGCVWSVCLSDDKSICVSGSGDGKVSVWNARTGALLQDMDCDGEVTCVSLSKDMKKICASDLGKGAISGRVTIFETWSGAMIRQMESKKGSGINTVQLSLDGTMAVSGDEGFLVCVWDAEQGEMLRSMRCGGIVFSVALSSDKAVCVSGDHVGDVILWDTATGEVIRTMECATSVMSVSLSLDQKVVVSSESSGKIKLWLCDTGESGTRSLVCDDEVACARLSDDKAIIVSGDYAMQIRLWDPYTGEELSNDSYVTACDGAISCVCMSSDKSTVVSGDDLGKVIIWNISHIVGNAHDTDTAYASAHDRKLHASPYCVPFVP